MPFKPSLVALASALLLSACASLPSPDLPASITELPQKAVEDLTNRWNLPATVKDGVQATVLLTPMELPAEIRNRPVKIELEPGAEVKDLMAGLGRMGVSILMGDEAAGKKSFYVPRYEGTLGGLLANISRVTDTWFTWSDGAIIVSSKEKIAISFPQDTQLATQLEKEVKAFGVDALNVSSNAGMLSMQVTPSQYRKVKAYLERATANAAIVTLQMAIVNVVLKQDARQGIDWDGLSLAVGSRAAQAVVDPVLERAKAISNSGSSVIGAPVVQAPGTPPGTGTTTPAAQLVSAVTGAILNAGSLQGVVTTGQFSFGAMFNFLNKYGNAETRQNTVFKTVTGQEVSFKSVIEVPYVSEIGTVSVGTTGTNNNNGVSTSQTGLSVKTDKAKDGLELSLLPTFDASADTVSIKLKMSLKSVLGFNELSAGNSVGKISQPTTADRSFNDEIRLRPGQTAVIGGLVYDSVSDNRALPLAMKPESRLESQSLKVDRQAMFIVLRPSVERLGGLGEAQVDELQLLPSGTFSLPPKLEVRPASNPDAAKKAVKPEPRSANTRTPPRAATNAADAPLKQKPDQPSKKAAPAPSDYAPLLPSEEE